MRTSAGVYRYVAVWDDTNGGYFFEPPGRPSSWATSYLTPDATGTMTVGDASADWSHGPLGHALASSDGSFVFSPVEVDYGAGWDSYRTGEPIWWGMLTGFACDLTLAIYGAAVGGMIRAAEGACG